jgi:rfaE bifunctional protein kinase chain/domain
LVVGDLVADRYIFGRTDRISREAPVLIVRHEREEVRLGGAANAAWNLAALGAQVTALGVLGDDDMGTALDRLCSQSGIVLDAVRDPSLRTECKTRILAGGVNTSRQQMLRLDQGQEGELPSSIRSQLAERLNALAAQHDAVLISDYGAGVLARESIAAACECAKQRPVTVDSRYQMAAFIGVTVAKPNEPELGTATGLPIGDATLVERAARALRKQLSAEAVLVTRGREGMVLVTPRGSDRIAPHGPRDAVDVTGAGDTVIATFTIGLAVGASMAAAARLANVAGGLVVQKPGTATVDLDELGRAMQAH